MDDSDGPNATFESLVVALGRAKRELGVAVGHGIDALQNWVARRWMPLRLLLVGGSAGR